MNLEPSSLGSGNWWENCHGWLMVVVLCSSGAGKQCWRDGSTSVSWLLASVKLWTCDCLMLRLYNLDLSITEILILDALKTLLLSCWL